MGLLLTNNNNNNNNPIIFIICSFPSDNILPSPFSQFYRRVFNILYTVEHVPLPNTKVKLLALAKLLPEILGLAQWENENM